VGCTMRAQASCRCCQPLQVRGLAAGIPGAGDCFNRLLPDNGVTLHLTASAAVSSCS
jgi:hypothetical protein